MDIRHLAIEAREHPISDISALTALAVRLRLTMAVGADGTAVVLRQTDDGLRRPFMIVYPDHSGAFWRMAGEEELVAGPVIVKDGILVADIATLFFHELNGELAARAAVSGSSLIIDVVNDAGQPAVAVYNSELGRLALHAIQGGCVNPEPAGVLGQAPLLGQIYPFPRGFIEILPMDKAIRWKVCDRAGRSTAPAYEQPFPEGLITAIVSPGGRLCCLTPERLATCSAYHEPAQDDVWVDLPASQLCGHYSARGCTFLFAAAVSTSKARPSIAFCARVEKTDAPPRISWGIWQPRPDRRSTLALSSLQPFRHYPAFSVSPDRDGLTAFTLIPGAGEKFIPAITSVAM